MEIEVKSEVIETTPIAQVPDQELTEMQQILKSFNDTLPKFIEKVANYEGSKKQLQRVMCNLALSPLNKEEIQFDPNYPAEKELFELGELINSTKYMLMILGLEAEGKIKIVKAFDEPASPEALTTESVLEERK